MIIDDMWFTLILIGAGALVIGHLFKLLLDIIIRIFKGR